MTNFFYIFIEYEIKYQHQIHRLITLTIFFEYFTLDEIFLFTIYMRINIFNFPFLFITKKTPNYWKLYLFFYILEDSSPFVIGFIGGIVGAITFNLITFIFYYSIKYKRNKSDDGKLFTFNKLKGKIIQIKIFI